MQVVRLVGEGAKPVYCQVLEIKNSYKKFDYIYSQLSSGKAAEEALDEIRKQQK